MIQNLFLTWSIGVVANIHPCHGWAASSILAWTAKITIMKTFKDLEFEQINDAPFMVGKRSRIHFDNGFGVSVVSHTYSYGGRDGLYEVAVLDSDDNLTYETPVTDNVIGYLTEEDVTDVMKQVQELWSK